MTARLFIPLLAAWLCVPGPSPAQVLPRAAEASRDDGPLPDSAGALPPSLTLTSEPGGLRVYDGPVFLGTTPLRDVPVAPGPVRLNIFPADTTYWFSTCLVDSFVAPDSGTVTRHVVFPKWVRVASEPFGAGVFLGDSLIGNTPLLAFVPPGTASLTIRSEGYADRTIFLGSSLHTSVRADLTMGGTAAGPQRPILPGDDGKGYTAVYIATASAVLTGTTAAILKNRADRYYDDYRETGSADALDRVRRYDLLSGIALAATEIGLGYLIYELLSR